MGTSGIRSTIKSECRRCDQCIAHCPQPFIGSVLSFMVLGEQPTWWDLGAVGVIAGLVLVVREKRDYEAGTFVGRLRRILTQPKSLHALQMNAMSGLVSGNRSPRAP